LDWMERRVLCVDWTEYTVLMCGLDGIYGAYVWTGLNVGWWCVDWMEHRMLYVDWTEYTLLMCGLTELVQDGI
jgi:hypothetical protein